MEELVTENISCLINAELVAINGNTLAPTEYGDIMNKVGLSGGLTHVCWRAPFSFISDSKQCVVSWRCLKGLLPGKLYGMVTFISSLSLPHPAGSIAWDSGRRRRVGIRWEPCKSHLLTLNPDYQWHPSALLKSRFVAWTHYYYSIPLLIFTKTLNYLRRHHDIRFAVNRLEKTADKVFLLIQVCPLFLSKSVNTLMSSKAVLAGISLSAQEYRSNDSQLQLDALGIFRHVTRIARGK